MILEVRNKNLKAFVKLIEKCDELVTGVKLYLKDFKQELIPDLKVYLSMKHLVIVQASEPFVQNYESIIVCNAVYPRRALMWLQNLSDGDANQS